MILAGTPEPDRRELQLRWWTFAGGRINATLRYALEALSPGWKIVPDNFMLKIRGDVDRERFRMAGRDSRTSRWPARPG